MLNLSVTLFESSPLLKGGVFALGNFDGVHRGHQVVIQKTIEHARQLGVPARVMTFEPHPRSLFMPNKAPFRLTPEQAKTRLLRGLGIDDVVVLPFTPEFSYMPAREFVDHILLREYGAQHIVAGYDFLFGSQRGGTMALMREWLAPLGVGVTEIMPFCDEKGEVLSSSRVREALQKGDLATAEHILGRRWSLEGVIQQGAQRGRTIGVPTANMGLADYLRPKFGVYAVRAGRVGSVLNHAGVANIGTRPTVDGKTETLEFHLFDFDETIYGEEWEVELLSFIRPERVFADFEALRGQIALDIEAARDPQFGTPSYPLETHKGKKTPSDILSDGVSGKS